MPTTHPTPDPTERNSVLQQLNHPPMQPYHLDHIFSNQQPNTFIEVIRNKDWARDFVAYTNLHLTWDLWHKVVIPTRIINQDRQECHPNWSRTEILGHQYFLLFTYINSYMHNGGSDEQKVCSRLLQKHNDVYPPDDRDDTLLPPWPD
jgi:hypothetical protein